MKRKKRFAEMKKNIAYLQNSEFEEPGTTKKFDRFGSKFLKPIIGFADFESRLTPSYVAPCMECGAEDACPHRKCFELGREKYFQKTQRVLIFLKPTVHFFLQSLIV